MKNIFLLLAMMAGILVSDLQAQSCPPCPPCPACPHGCCMGNGNKMAKAETASVELLPVGIFSLATCTPEAKTTCEDKKMSKKEMKASHAACDSKNAHSCIPSTAIVPTSEAVNDQSYHQAQKPVKG